jgi:three-Cys-motif partner protein
VSNRWIAGDGLPARPSGQWTQEKLRYVERYASAFMVAMHPSRREGKWRQLVYIDLLAGPGKGIDRRSHVEFDGSPLRALRIRPAFDRLFLPDKSDANVVALRARIATEDQSRVEIEAGDCNERSARLIQTLPQKTLGLAFVDPEGFEVTFSMLKTLAQRPIDVLLFFPSVIGIRRNLRQFMAQDNSPMDVLWGGKDWRDLRPAKLAAGKDLSATEIETRDKPWVARFREKMVKIGFNQQDEGDPCFRNKKNAPMYHLLFFSRSAIGLKIWRNIKKIEPTGQRALPGV